MSLVYLELWNLVDLVPVSANLRETLKQLLQYKATVLTDVPHALLHLITWVISPVVQWVIPPVFKWVISPVVESSCTKTASELTASGHLYLVKSPLNEDCQQIHHYTAFVSYQIPTERRLSTNTLLHSICIISNPHWTKTVNKYITTQHLYHVKSPLKEDCQQIHYYTAFVSYQIPTERRLLTNPSLHSISIIVRATIKGKSRYWRRRSFMHQLSFRGKDLQNNSLGMAIPDSVCTDRAVGISKVNRTNYPWLCVGISKENKTIYPWLCVCRDQYGK